MEWVIYRPTGYFYDIAKVFKPYVDKGEMQLLKGYGGVKANVVDCPDFAQFIVDHMNDTNVTYNVGGKETYTYEEMAAMCFDAAKKPLKIKWAPIWLFGILANLPKIKKAGKWLGTAAGDFPRWKARGIDWFAGTSDWGAMAAGIRAFRAACEGGR